MPTRHQKGTRASQTRATLITGRSIPVVPTSATLTKTAPCLLLWWLSAQKWTTRMATPPLLQLRSATRTPVATVLLQARQLTPQAREDAQPSLAACFRAECASNSSVLAQQTSPAATAGRCTQSKVNGVCKAEECLLTSVHNDGQCARVCQGIVFACSF